MPDVALYRRARKRLQRAVRSRGQRIRARDVRQTLHSLGPLTAPALMVHSSLSACGFIEGGAETVIDALVEWVGPSTLVMPTHTYCYPTEQAAAPFFKVGSTPSLVGAITNAFWPRAGVVRSLHPTHSIAGLGSLAEALCADHEWTDTPCGPGTPYERLVRHDSAVLLFGATLDSYTFFHTAEDAAGCPYLYLSAPNELQFEDSLGLNWSYPSRRHDMMVPRRFGEMRGWLESRGLLRSVRLGGGDILLLEHSLLVHRALVEELSRDPFFLVASPPRASH